MRKTLATIAAALLPLLIQAQQRPDTLKISTLYTTHVVFTTEVTYADLSNTAIVAAKKVEQNTNMLAIKAREPFTTTASVTALEANGSIHTFILAYDEHPDMLIIDTRTPATEQPVPESGRRRSGRGVTTRHTTSGTANVSMVRRSDAPDLKEVIGYPQTVFHIAGRSQRITASCTNIFAYSDITYVTLTLSNRSGVSYEAADASFIIESRNKGKRKVVTEKNVFPKNRYGTLSAGPDETAKICYSLEKVTLSDDQVLKVYIYEQGGQRNLVLTLSPADVNQAKIPE